MDQVKINVVNTQILECDIESLRSSCVECGPHLGCDEDILALDAGIKGLLQSSSDLMFVSVTVCSVDVSVTVLESIGNSLLNFSGW